MPIDKMAFVLLSTTTATALVLVIVSVLVMRYLRNVTSQTTQTENAKNRHALDLKSNTIEPETTILSKELASALPDSVILPHNTAAFKKSMTSYWARQESEVVPACILRPRDAQELCIAVALLKAEYDKRGRGMQAEGLFAIRSGGHSPVPGAASIQGGVLIDLSLLCEVAPSEDGSSVAIGAGAKWADVSRVLDEKGLAVVGGRNSAVGVGGLALGGGLSFFSPRFGLVCSNILTYEVVLASGSIVTASATSHPDLWRALKGGSNNFGIVTRFTARSFPSTKIWSGFLYMPSFQATKALAAFHDCVNNSMNDTYAAGPITCFTYIQALGIQAISVNLVYTKPPNKENKWPTYWKITPLSSLWRLWSTCKIQTLNSATDEMSALNPPGRRQVFGTTTIENNIATLAATHAAYSDAIVSLRRGKVAGLVWTLVLQPLLPEWARKGDENPLGLQEGTDKPLVIVSFTVNWTEERDDSFVKATTRRAIEQIDASAVANGTSHPYRYLNYCAEWQRPFKGYGLENWRFLQGVSRRYDPEGLFQRGCVGGFKLDVDGGA